MLRYAHTISSSSRRLASRHPMFCDSCTAGPRQFYPLRNNNLLGEPAPYNTNLNDLINGGVWMVQTDGDKIDQNNFPQEVVNGWVRVYKNSNGAIKQVFYRYGTNDKTDGYVYTRTYNVNSKNWSRWTSYARMSDLFSNPIRVTDVHNIGKSCLFRAEYGSANTPTSDLGYIGISIYTSSNWQFVICSPYAGGKLFFDSVNTDGSWIGWKEITFK